MGRHSYEYVKEIIESKGYVLLSDTYKNNATKLSVICSKGHEYSASFNTIEQGHGCLDCQNNRRRFSYEYIQNYFKDNDYILLSNNYKNALSKLKVMCPKGHEMSITYNKFKLGTRCFICQNNKRSHSYEYIKNFIEKEGYTLLSDSYKNSVTKLKIVCDKGHKYSVSFGNFRSGHRCNKCFIETASSKQEQNFALFIESLGIPIIKNDRTQIVNPLTGYNLELDVWIPSINKAIEYNGIYWHSLPYQIQKDKIKQDQCKQQNIDLLIVDEYNWINNNNFEKIKIENWIFGL
jgi:hypothetical protein